MTKMSAIALYSSYTVTKLNAVKLVYCGQPSLSHVIMSACTGIRGVSASYKKLRMTTKIASFFSSSF